MISQEKIIDLLGERYTDQALLREYIERCLYDVIECAEAELKACKSENFSTEEYKECSENLEMAFNTMTTAREILRNPDGKNYSFFRKVIKETHDRVREKAYIEYLEKHKEGSLNV